MTAFGLERHDLRQRTYPPGPDGRRIKQQKSRQYPERSRYKALATAFNFAANGAATTSSASTVQTTVSNFDEQTLETECRQD